jgi:hypothetical protein
VCGASGKLYPAFERGIADRLGTTDLRAIQESFGITINYPYDHDSIESNVGSPGGRRLSASRPLSPLFRGRPG